MGAILPLYALLHISRTEPHSSESTILGTLSKTVRGYAQALPQALPPPPRVSRPVSLGSFFGSPDPPPPSTSAPRSRQQSYRNQTGAPSSASHGHPSPAMGATDATARRRGASFASSAGEPVGRHAQHYASSEASSDDREGAEGIRYPATRAPVSGEKSEEVLFATWDVLDIGSGASKKYVLPFVA
jgi:hypothetical protein